MRQRFTSPPVFDEDESAADDYQDIIRAISPRRYVPEHRQQYGSSRHYPVTTGPPSFHSHRSEDPSQVEQQQDSLDTNGHHVHYDLPQEYDDTQESERPVSYARYEQDQELGGESGAGEMSYDGVYLSPEEEKYGLASPASLLSTDYFNSTADAVPVGAQPRRNRTSRRVKLTAGNLVLDCLVPTRLLGFLPRKEDDEMRYTRYSAVTTGPEGFEAGKFELRQSLLNRETELMIVVTLYNVRYHCLHVGWAGV